MTAGGAAWVASRGQTISDELGAASNLAPTLKANLLNNDPQAAVETVHALKLHTLRAREAATDPFFTIAGELPWIGSNFQAVAVVATSADDVARLGAEPLLSVFASLDMGSIKLNGGGIDLDPIVKAEPRLDAAADAVQQSADRLHRIDTGTLMPQVASPLIKARDELTALRDDLNTVADVAQLLPAMMGEQSPRSYLLLVQNNAELRATGGIPGALAVLAVDEGKLTLESQSSASALGAFRPVVNVDPEQEQIYSSRLGKFMQDVNLTPDFPTAAHTAQEMWERKTGNRVDGVVSIDPVALGYVLDATGPVSVEQTVKASVGGDLPTELTAQNVVPTLLSKVYSEIDQPAMQDIYFAGAAKAIFDKLSAGADQTERLVDSLVRGAAERRVQLWSQNADEQALIARYALGGAVTGSHVPPAQFGVYFNDGTGAKMDYFVKRTVKLIQVCPANGYTETKVRVTTTNTAPNDAKISLPTYVTGGGIYGVPVGSVQTNVIAYGPVQSNVESVTRDGQKTPFAPYLHAGRPVGVIAQQLAPGETKTLEFTFGKIVQHTEPNLVVTPTVQAAKDVILPLEVAQCSQAE